MARKGTTLFFEEKLYKDFRTFCKHEGLVVSRQFEIFMENKLGKNDTDKTNI